MSDTTSPLTTQVDAHGLASHADHDILAALNHALRSHAKRLCQLTELGALNTVECHLSSGEVCLHRFDTQQGTIEVGQA